MNYSGWPHPPIVNHSNPPDVPIHFTIFGSAYKLVDGNPLVDLPSHPLNCQAIKEQIGQSFESFIRYVETADTEWIDKINEIHSKLNEEINKAKACNGDETIQMSKSKTVEMKKYIINQIKKLMQ